jgi:hypothetical protein
MLHARPLSHGRMAAAAPALALADGHVEEVKASTKHKAKRKKIKEIDRSPLPLGELSMSALAQTT